MDSFAFEDSFSCFPSCALPPPPSSSSSFEGISSSFSPDPQNSSSRFPLLPSFSDSLENSSQSFWSPLGTTHHQSAHSLSACSSPSELPASPTLSSSPCPASIAKGSVSLSSSQQSLPSFLKDAAASQRSSPSLGASSPPPSVGLDSSSVSKDQKPFSAPFSLHDFALLPFLCSRVYVQFAADGVLPPEVKLALRHPHGYEYTVREPRMNKRDRRKELKQEDKPAGASPQTPLPPSHSPPLPSGTCHHLSLS